MKKYKTLGVSALALMIGASSGAAVGLNQNFASSDALFGCVTGINGNITKVTTSDHDCPKGTSKVSWNRYGVQGPAGQPGPAGPEGSRGENGISLDPHSVGLWVKDPTNKFFKVVELSESGVKYMFQSNVLYFPFKNAQETPESLYQKYIENLSGSTDFVIYLSDDCSGDGYTFNAPLSNQKIVSRYGLDSAQISDSSDFPQPGVNSIALPEVSWLPADFRQSTVTITDFNVLDGKSFRMTNYGSRSIWDKFHLSSQSGIYYDPSSNRYLYSPSWTYSYNTNPSCIQTNWDQEFLFYGKAQKVAYWFSWQADKNWGGILRQQLLDLPLWKISEGINPGISELKLVTN